MDPALAFALLAAGIVAQLTEWLAVPAAIAIAVVGAALDVAGSLLFVAAMRAKGSRRNG